MSKLFTFGLVVLACALPALPAGATMTMAPYLQAVTTNSIYVLVECNSTSPVTVEYGTPPSYGTSRTTESNAATSGSSPQTYIHRVKLTGLTANTLYHYRAWQVAGAYSSDFTFTTAALPGTSYRFAFLADFRTGTGIHNNVAARVIAANPRFSIYGGDLCADSGYTTFKNEFFLANELALSAKVPFMNATGNHEGWTTNTQVFMWAPASGSGTQQYYSFDYGDVHFVSINNYVDYSVNDVPGTQYRFVKDDLANTTKPWKVVYFHEPAYCAGGSHAPNTVMQSYTTTIFEPRNVSLVLTGHNHYYEHCLVNNVHHFVLGSVGAPLYSVGTASYLVSAVSAYNYGIIDVTPKTLHMTTYVSADGTTNWHIQENLDLANCIAGAESLTDATALTVTVPAVVTYVPTETGVFYVQDPTGVGAIRVETSSTRPIKGNNVKIMGTLTTKANGERAITGALYPTPSGSVTIKPKAMSNRAVGGAGYVNNPGGGASNQGMLVKVWGKVSKAVGMTFWLDDGSGVDSGETDGTRGLKIIDSNIGPTKGDFMLIVGVVASEKVNGKTIRVIRFREQG